MTYRLLDESRRKPPASAEKRGCPEAGSLRPFLRNEVRCRLGTSGQMCVRTQIIHKARLILISLRSMHRKPHLRYNVIVQPDVSARRMVNPPPAGNPPHKNEKNETVVSGAA